MPSAKVKRTFVIPGGLASLFERAVGQPGLVDVGILNQGATYPDGTNVEQAALYNINGTAKIPKRDWINGFTAKFGKKYINLSTRMYQRVLIGKIARASALSVIGRDGETDMKNLVEGWAEPPNAPLTIRKKGFNDPLIHTRRLLKEIRWRIHDRSKHS
jgi:hypothetical protein